MNFRSLFSKEILRRGHEYYVDMKVDVMDYNEKLIKGIIHGSEHYKVQINLRNSEIKSMICNCPYAKSGYNCKHMAALLFEVDEMIGADSYDDALDYEQWDDDFSWDPINSWDEDEEILAEPKEISLTTIIDKFNDDVREKIQLLILDDQDIEQYISFAKLVEKKKIGNEILDYILDICNEYLAYNLLLIINSKANMYGVKYSNKVNTLMRNHTNFNDDTSYLVEIIASYKPKGFIEGFIDLDYEHIINKDYLNVLSYVLDYKLITNDFVKNYTKYQSKKSTKVKIIEPINNCILDHLFSFEYVIARSLSKVVYDFKNHLNFKVNDFFINDLRVDHFIKYNIDGLTTYYPKDLITSVYDHIEIMSSQNTFDIEDLVTKLPHNFYIYNLFSKYIYSCREIQKFYLDFDELYYYFTPRYSLSLYRDSYILNLYLDLGDNTVYSSEYKVFSYEDSNSIRFRTFIIPESEPNTIVYIRRINNSIYNKFKDEILNRLKSKEEVYKEIYIQNTRDLLSDIINDFNTKIIPFDLESKPTIEYFIEYSKEYRSLIAISFKIGYNKKYIVKNVNDFLFAFENNDIIKYGKEFEFYHDLNNLKESDRKIIELLLILPYGNMTSENKRELNIYVETLDMIFSNLKGRIINFDNQSYLYKGDLIEPRLSVTKDYKFNLENYDSSKYIITRNSIYVFNLNTNEANIFKADDKTKRILEFAINNYDMSFALVKDTFKESIYYPFSRQIEVEEEIKEELYINSMEIECYLDYDNAIKVETKYIKNNEYMLESDIVLKYDIDKKNLYYKYLETLGFKNNIIKDELDILTFLRTDLSKLKEIATILISDSLSNKKIVSISPGKIVVSYNSGMLDAILTDSLYSDTELYGILNAIKKKKKFFKLNDDYLIDLTTDEALEFYNTIADLKLDTKKLNEVQSIPVYQSFKAYHHLDNIKIDKFLDNMVNDLANFKNMEYKLPNINAELRKYQIEGYNWLKVLNQYGLGGILADDMGLGKTLQVITLLASINTNKPSLIICPKTLIFNWESEFKRFYPEIEVRQIYGNSDYRKQLISEISNTKRIIYITSYDSLRSDVEYYKTNFEYVVIDEAQYIKNVYAGKSKAVKKIKALHRLALTGTPIENNIYDLWSIFDFIIPGFLPELTEFKHNYEASENYSKIIASNIAPFILRRVKSEVLKDLPDKYETIITAEMNESQRKIYDAQKLLAKDMVSSGAKSFDILPILTRLRQVCVDPKLVVENYVGFGGKLEMLYSIINEYLSNGRKIVIFSQFVEALKLIEEYLNENMIKYYIITGKTDARMRLDYANSFNQEDTDVSIFLVSLKAGGTGLNLIGADTVIHLDPWWNQAVEAQATDRTYRIGQNKNVEVIKLICENSVEQKVIELQNMKKDLFDKMISSDDSSITSIKMEDLSFILNS